MTLNIHSPEKNLYFVYKQQHFKLNLRYMLYSVSKDGLKLYHMNQLSADRLMLSMCIYTYDPSMCVL